MEIQMAPLWQIKLLACKKASQDDQCIPMIAKSIEPNSVNVTFTIQVTGEEVAEFRSKTIIGTKEVTSE